MEEKKNQFSPSSFTTFGELLRYLRKRAELTQRDMAARVGYHFSHYNRIEKDQRLPDVATVQARIIPALELRADDDGEWISRLLELLDSKPVRHKESSVEPISVDDAYTLPAGLTSMIGREKEVAQLEKLLSQPEIRLLTLVGPPGVGKTALAQDVGRKISQLFQHGAVFVNLSPITNYELVLHTLAQTLGLIQTTAKPNLEMLQAFLAKKELLVIMDNFEQVLDASPQLLALLNAAPEIKIITTSREALRIQGEQEYPVAPLPFPVDVSEQDTDILEDFPAIQLFIQRAIAVNPNFTLTKENASLIAEICQRLDGLPLAIELAAARSQTISPADMIAQFDRLFDWLTRGKRDTPLWRQTLLGAIEWSYSLLDENERILYLRLSVFSGTWTQESAQIVCSDETQLDASAVIQLQSQLADRSLVVVEFINGTTRFRFLEIIRRFALEKLRETPEWDDIHNRHLEYYSDFARSLKSELETETPRELRARMDLESNNIRSALEWGLQSRVKQGHALALMNAAGAIWLKHSTYTDALGWVKRYMPLVFNYPSEHAPLLFLATALSYWCDNLQDAIKFADEGIKIAETTNDPESMAGILYYMGDIYREIGDLSIAQKSVEKSIVICEQNGYTVRHSMALTSLGAILYELGSKDEGKSKNEEAIELAVHGKNVWAHSYALRTKADKLLYEEKYLEAYHAYQDALTISSEIEDRISMGMEYSNLSLIANVLNDYPTSMFYAENALTQFQLIGNTYHQYFPFRMMAYALAYDGDINQAREFCMKSLKGNQSINHKAGVLSSLICLATIQLEEGNLSGAGSMFQTINLELSKVTVDLMKPDIQALDKLNSQIKVQEYSLPRIPIFQAK